MVFQSSDRKKCAERRARVIVLSVIVAATSICCGVASASAPNSTLTGRASVIDGDTVEIQGERVRLNGVDAPESSQLCGDQEGKRYRCGAESANALSKFLETSNPLTCHFVTRDRYGRFVGDCYLANGRSVAEWLVLSGLALDWPRYSSGKYAHLQEQAKENRSGLWRGEFQPPWEWRADRKDATPPAEAAPQPLVSEQEQQCQIKGNISSKGERIYHSPGQRDYAKTRISVAHGERWFCTAEEADSAGWRPARN